MNMGSVGVVYTNNYINLEGRLPSEYRQTTSTFVKHLDDNIGKITETPPQSGRTSGILSVGGTFPYLTCESSISYHSYTSENYRIEASTIDNCFHISNKNGERLATISYEDANIKKDTETGKEFLISEHGTAAYDALVLNKELEEDLKNAMGVEKIETVPLTGYTLNTHSETGIQYIIRDGEEGRGGKVLFQNSVDEARYEALAESYYKKYPNLVADKAAGYIYADLEIRGLVERSGNGIVSIGYNGMSYHDNDDDKKNWAATFDKNVFIRIDEWIKSNRKSMKDWYAFSFWDKVFKKVGGEYERVWSDDELKQGYLNQ